MNGWSVSQCAIINFEPNDFSALELKISNQMAKQICLENWDSDGDGKFTYGEAAAVTDLGEAFRRKDINGLRRVVLLYIGRFDSRQCLQRLCAPLLHPLAQKAGKHRCTGLQRM